MSIWHTGGTPPPASNPRPSAFMGTASWLSIVIGILLALYLTPLVYLEVYEPFIQAFLEDLYGAGTTGMTLVNAAFGAGIFVASVLISRMVVLAIVVTSALTLSAFGRFIPAFA